MLKSHFAVFCLFVIGTTGCAPSDAPHTELAHTVTVSGTLDAGDSQSDWTARFSDDSLVSILEHSSAGDYGESTTEYHFQENVLRTYNESGRRQLAPGSEKKDVAIRIDFESAVAVESSKTVDGVNETVRDFEISAALRQSVALAEQAVFRRGNPPPTLRCLGNEPFWKVDVQDSAGSYSMLGDAAGERQLGARWQWEATSNAFSWAAREMPSGDFFVRATIVAEHCADSMSDEGPPFTHSAILDVSNGGRLTGCCRPLQ